MREVPANALPVGRLPRATIPELEGRIAVQARIVAARAERWVAGTAHAWTRDPEAVCVWWTDTDSLQRIDWLSALDVRRGRTAWSFRSVKPAAAARYRSDDPKKR